MAAYHLRPKRAATDVQTHIHCTHMSVLPLPLVEVDFDNDGRRGLETGDNGAQTSNYESILCQYAQAATTKTNSSNDDDRTDVETTGA